MDRVLNTARITKDKNFDGKFFFGVKTTGIFCRPSCPAPVAKEENVVYFKTIFDALERDFRPCYRCRPDISVEYYNKNLDGVYVVNTALGMIYDGYLNSHSLRDLSCELLVSDRHLRKLFVDNLGVPPVKIARYHKSLFAKKLLVFSNQSITDIAFASGFGSIRQFNDVFKKIFGKTPTAVRNEACDENGGPNDTTLLLKYQKPFNFKQAVAFMKPRAMEGVERITENSYGRTFRAGGTKGYVIVEDCPEKSILELRIGCDDIKCYMEIYNKIRKVFDLDTDFSAINFKFAKDRLLSKGMVDGHVPRLPIAFDPFEFAVRAILGQQISVKAATTLAARIAKKAGVESDNSFPHGLNRFFPNPSELSNLKLDGLGLTRTRQETIKTLTQAIIDKKVVLTANQSFETFQKDFSALKGIGDWTVNYVAMRGLGMIDSFPATDLGIVKALSNKSRTPSKKEILGMAEHWRPYRSYATLCLWNQ
ncbi:Ada metal-binding domain-containing protein [Desulfobacterales bacterium HSG16]|nr:Ada metal-binding domain-containing protein [Desulfobacterales bacterium HSG16]